MVADNRAASVYGQPYETVNAVTIIPVATVRGRTEAGRKSKPSSSRGETALACSSSRTVSHRGLPAVDSPASPSSGAGGIRDAAFSTLACFVARLARPEGRDRAGESSVRAPCPGESPSTNHRRTQGHPPGRSAAAHLVSANGDPQDPVIAAAGRLQGALAGWVHRHGGWPWIVALAVLVLGALAWAWRAHATSAGGSRPSGRATAGDEP